MQRIANKVRTDNDLLRECFAECLGTFILMVFGDGSVAQVVLSKETKGTYISINWAFGLGVTMAVYVSGGVSGGHINPAVSLTNCVLGRLPWKKLPFYITSQMIGAFLAAAVVFGVYHDAMNAFDGGTRQVYGPNATAGIFSTFPEPHLTIINGLMDQIFGTALLLCCVLAIVDNRNNKPPPGLEPLLIGFLVFAIGTSFGFNCGYAINPARDFGPRLFTAIAGWGTDVFFGVNGEQWWWVPIVGPLVGALVGALVYQFLIEMHWPLMTSQLSVTSSHQEGDLKKNEFLNSKDDISKSSSVDTHKF